MGEFTCLRKIVDMAQGFESRLRYCVPIVPLFFFLMTSPVQACEVTGETCSLSPFLKSGFTNYGLTLGTLKYPMIRLV